MNWESFAASSTINRKRTNIMCGKNVESLMLNLVVHKITTGLKRFNDNIKLYLNWRNF